MDRADFLQMWHPSGPNKWKMEDYYAIELQAILSDKWEELSHDELACGMCGARS